MPVLLLEDAFPTAQGSGWPNSENGLAWTTSAPSEIFTSGGKGIQRHTATNQTRSSRSMSVSAQDAEFRGRVSLDKVMTGSNLDVHVGFRVIDDSNMYRLRLRFTTSNTVSGLHQMSSPAP